MRLRPCVIVEQVRKRLLLALEHTATEHTSSDGMVEEQKNDRSARCDNQAIHVQSGDACKTEQVSEPAANGGPNDSEENIQHHALTTMVYQMARNESCQ